MTTALFVLGCLLFGGGTVVFLRALPGIEAHRDSAELTPPMPPSAPMAPLEGCSGTPVGRADHVAVDDFMLWEGELGEGRHSGW